MIYGLLPYTCMFLVVLCMAVHAAVSVLELFKEHFLFASVMINFARSYDYTCFSKELGSTSYTKVDRPFSKNIEPYNHGMEFVQEAL